MPFIWAAWQIAPVIILPAPTQPTRMGLPCASRLASFCVIMVPVPLPVHRSPFRNGGCVSLSEDQFGHA